MVEDFVVGGVGRVIAWRLFHSMENGHTTCWKQRICKSMEISVV